MGRRGYLWLVGCLKWVKGYVGDYGVFVILVMVVTVFCINVKTFYCVEVWLFVTCIGFLVW